MFKKSRSFFFKLNCMVLGTFAVTVSLVTIILGWNWGESLNQALNGAGIAAARKSATIVDRIQSNAECIGKLYAENLSAALNKRSTFEEISDPLRKNITKFLDIEPCIVGACLAFVPNTFPDKQKYNLLYNSARDNSSNFSISTNGAYIKEDWFMRAQRERKPFWSEPLNFSPDGGGSAKAKPERSCLYVVPLIKEDGQFVGALGIQLSLVFLRESLSQNQIDGEGFCCLLSPQGNFITHPLAELEDRENIFSVVSRTNNPQDLKTAAKLLNGEEMNAVFSVSPYYKTGVFMFVSPCRNGWITALALPGDWLSSKLNTLLYHILIIFALTMSVLIFVLRYSIKKLSQPLSDLSQTAKLIGEGRFTGKIPQYKYDDEIGQLTKSFAQMQRELKNYLTQLKHNLEERERIEGELNVAKQIQTGILPRLEDALPQCDFYVLDATLSPAKGVGGDLYDFFYIDDKHIAVIIGDVSGKGVPAALFMAITQTLQRSIAGLLHTPEAIVSRLNDFLSVNNDASMFVTYFLGIVNIDTGEMTYCNAGHNPPLILRKNGQLEKLTDIHGLPLAVFPEVYESSSTHLNRGDTLCLYTDGVTEAFSLDDELYGEERLERTIAALGSGTPQEIIQTVMKDVSEFSKGREQSDDITMLAMHRN